MLAQNFKSASELGITEPQFNALQKTLVLLETGKLQHVPIGDGYYPDAEDFTGHFNMQHWNSQHDCDTVCCIGGTAELVGNVEFKYSSSDPVYDLFFPHVVDENLWNGITTTQAAIALRSFLTTGDPHWELAMHELAPHTIWQPRA